MSEAFKNEIVQRITRNLLDIQILRLLETQPKWGYLIKKQIEAKYAVKLGHGALYPLLNTLEQNGFITSQKRKQGGRTRKVYELTSRGKEYITIYKTILKEQIECKDSI